MTVAEVDLLIVFVVEFDRGPADMAYLGRNFSCDALALNLQGYLEAGRNGTSFTGASGSWGSGGNASHLPLGNHNRRGRRLVGTFHIYVVAA